MYISEKLKQQISVKTAIKKCIGCNIRENNKKQHSRVTQYYTWVQCNVQYKILCNKPAQRGILCKCWSLTLLISEDKTTSKISLLNSGFD